MPKSPSKQPGKNSICPHCLDKGHQKFQCPNLNQSRPRGSNSNGGSGIIKAHKKKKLHKTNNKQEKSPMIFEHELGSVPPGNAKNLVALLNGIRDHLCGSESTRAIYVAMAKEFFDSLPSDVQQKTKIPEDKDFVDYIEYKWPAIKTFTSVQEQVQWGYVQKSGEMPHSIHILSDIVVSAEKAAAIHMTPETMELQLFNIVIMVIIFHELAHSFTKLWFNEAITLLGVGVRNSTVSGWLVEERIMGGRVEVEWDKPEDAFNMDLIAGVHLRSQEHSLVFSKFMVHLKNIS